MKTAQFTGQELLDRKIFLFSRENRKEGPCLCSSFRNNPYLFKHYLFKFVAIKPRNNSSVFLSANKNSSPMPFSGRDIHYSRRGVIVVAADRETEVDLGEAFHVNAGPCFYEASGVALVPNFSTKEQFGMKNDTFRESVARVPPVKSPLYSYGAFRGYLPSR